MRNGNGRKRLFEEVEEEVLLSSSVELSPLGHKNLNKLRQSGQLDSGVSPKRCQLCGNWMDWRSNGPIQKQRNGRYTYQGHCAGACQKKGVNDKSNPITSKKMIAEAETTKKGFIHYISNSQSYRYAEDTLCSLKFEYGRLLDGFDYFGPNDELSGLSTILRNSPSFDSDGAGFVWVAQRWNNDVGHVHKEQELAHFCKFSNRFCNDASKDIIHEILQNVASSFDSLIAVPSSWSFEQPIPPFPYELNVDEEDEDFQDFKQWVDLRLGKRDENGNWITGWWIAGEAKRNTGRDVAVTKQYLYKLYWSNGGSFCRIFGVKGSWKPGAWNLFSIDKIDYRKGYVEGNLMIVLYRANDARFRYKWSDFLRWRNAIVNKWKIVE